jgi:hypothetical protein
MQITADELLGLTGIAGYVLAQHLRLDFPAGPEQ